ncbi:MAG: dynamin family protein [Desulfovibrionaceae bacterium]|nr:dynamin family protein [Desulfovibrionaceae bacterium]
MAQLPEYQKIVLNSLCALESLPQKYSSSDSPLGKVLASTVDDTYQRAKRHCEERLSSDLPKVMLYGVYNSGKSTLLNAFIGEELARVADIPTTDTVTPYAWRGYELLDTPGINAPIEHQAISLEALRECQVVIFVVSAARSFENRTIYEAMRDVVQRGKHLIIVLNDKEGLGLGDERVVEAKKSVQRNLQAVGFSAEESANFRLCLVNAQLALEGRLEDDSELVQESGIIPLENLIVQEIKRVNGFHVLSDLCTYLTTSFEPFVKALVNASKTDDETLPLLLRIREEYDTFCAAMERKVDEECASLPTVLLRSFPSANEVAASGGLDADAVGVRVEETCKKYTEAVNTLFQQEVDRYKNHLAAQLNTLLPSPLNRDDTVPSHQVRAGTLPNADTMPFMRESAPSTPEVVATSDVVDKIEAVSSLLGGSSLASAVIRLPIPYLSPIAIPLGTVLFFLPKILRVLFGKSEADMRDERVEAQAAAERRAQEEHARNLALWRQELLQYCLDVKADFSREMKKSMRDVLKNSVEPVLCAAEDEFLRRKGSAKDILEDAALYSKALSELSLLKTSLVSPSDLP